MTQKPGGGRHRSHSDPPPTDAAAETAARFAGSLGGAHASFVRSDSTATPDLAAGGLAPTADTVAALEGRDRDPLISAVDSALVTDLISQVHRERLRRNRRAAMEDDEVSGSPEPRQLAFTRICGGGEYGSDPDAVRTGKVESQHVRHAPATSGAGLPPDEPRPASVDVRTVSMLEVARRLRVPLGALVGALAMSDDRREVKVRGDSPSCPGVGSTCGSPLTQASTRRGQSDQEPLLGGRNFTGTEPERQGSVILDINFHDEVDRQSTSGVEDDAYDDSVSQPRHGTLRKLSSQQLDFPKAQAFGLALSPANVVAPEKGRVAVSNRGTDGFHEWRRGVQQATSARERDAQVTVELPDANGKKHLSHDAYIVRDPSVPKGSMPQYVLAVATLPEDVRHGQNKKLFHLPGEVDAVTVYCDCSNADADTPSVILSAQLSQPAWAWAVLLFGVGCLSCVFPVVGRLRTHADDAPTAAVWWATAELIVLSVLFVLSCTTRRWTSAEWLTLNTGTGTFFSRYFYVIIIMLVGLGGGGAQALWIQAYTAQDHKNEAKEGPPSQVFALHALHPLIIIAYRLARAQRLYFGEVVGVAGVLVGMGLLAYPGPDKWDSSWALPVVYAAASSVCVAAWIIGSKVIAAQLPASAILTAAAVIGFATTLVVAVICGSCTSASDVFGWATDSTAVQWWIVLMFLSAGSKLALVNALRYMHSITISVSMCVAAMCGAVWSEYCFDVDVPGGMNPAWAVPGLLVCGGGAALAAYTTSVRRQYVEVEVTPSPQGVLAKRARPTTRLTPGALAVKQRQEHGGRTLYHDAAAGMRQPPGGRRPH
eukprot:TRINITY_DN618_c3_g1_i1.p1 TRINITY_DN618_c3_g1~~TRINITY_DN618_c3_g1_i1.p1  ORF type:complete len:824 (+),score=290.41 TRINITY_DN618_c3_g1_i1:192-2663(+)